MFVFIIVMMVFNPSKIQELIYILFQFMNYLRGLDWRDPAVVANFQRMHFNSTVDHQCMGATLGSVRTQLRVITLFIS